MSVKSASVVTIATEKINESAYSISGSTLTINTSNCTQVGKHLLIMQVRSTGFLQGSTTYFLPTMEFEVDVEIKLCSLKNTGLLDRTNPTTRVVSYGGDGGGLVDVYNTKEMWEES